MKVLVCDKVSEKGVEVFRKSSGIIPVVLDRTYSETEMMDLVKDVAGIVVRSETKITARIIESAPLLKVVGRAGVGVDNVDVEAATRRGVIVMNTPGGNTISTCELTFSMMLAMARNIPQAHISMKKGEWNRKSFKGNEIFQKVLGIIGLGRIGAEVARRALAFGMKVKAFDPYLSRKRAEELGVELCEELDSLLQASDYITVHMPKTVETTGMINAKSFRLMKDGVRILNCARGGIIHEGDLEAALKSGKVAGAALDVYEYEPISEDHPFRSMANVIMTPHLGASTDEAQENVGIEVAEAIVDYLIQGEVRNAVNLPNMDSKTYCRVQPYLKLAEKLGRLVAQLSPKRNDRIVITYGGKVTEVPGDPLTRSVLKGFLQSAGGEGVNEVNVRTMAESLGLLVEEIKSNEKIDYVEWIHVSAHSGGEKISAGGTIFGARYEPRIVRVHSRPVEIIPDGVLLFYLNEDRPGIVGKLGTILGQFNVNIASMSLSRKTPGGQALTVLNLDSRPSAEAIAAIENEPSITNVQIVEL